MAEPRKVEIFDGNDQFFCLVRWDRAEELVSLLNALKRPESVYTGHMPIPADFPVQPLQAGQEAKDRATCGTCGLSWDDAISTSMTPAPSARCPFEGFHIYADE